MEVICPSCATHLKFPDDKIPPGRQVTVPCPKCRAKLTIPEPAPEGHGDQDSAAENYNSEDRPFDFVEEEGRTALVCQPDAGLRATIIEALRLMEYHITVTENTREALKKMRYHDYHLVVADELFDTTNPETNGVLVFLERMPMATRRNIFVCMVSSRFRTMDYMLAFNRSVNLIVNRKNVSDFAKILESGIADHEYFYRVYRDVRKQMGRG
jgi:CheY-like chemotaxis protein